jgi:transcriptional regulator with XRE-family HTH domain
MEDELILKKLGEKISAYRSFMEISQKELSEKCGLHINYIQQLENGKRNPSLITLIKIRKGLDTSFKYLLDGV